MKWIRDQPRGVFYTGFDAVLDEDLLYDEQERKEAIKIKNIQRYVLIITAVIAIGIISWLIDVFGRTLHPSPAHHASVMPVAKTWDGHVMVVRRSDPMASLGW